MWSLRPLYEILIVVTEERRNVGENQKQAFEEYKNR